MLTAFHNHLKQLSVDPRDPYTSIVRKIAGPTAAPQFERPLRELVLAMPAMIRQIGDWAEEPAQPAATKRLHSFLLRYLYHPSDFLSERNLGFFGYLDDAYVVARVFARTLEEDDEAGLKPHVQSPEIAAEVHRWIEAARRLLPDETKRIDQMLNEFKYYRDKSFFWAIDRASKGTKLSRKLEKDVSR